MGSALHVLVLPVADGPEEHEERHHAHDDGDRDEYEQSHFFVPEDVSGPEHGTRVWPVEVRRKKTRRGSLELPRLVRCGRRVYLPSQTVPASFWTGTPTALPYSVHEPS